MWRKLPSACGFICTSATRRRVCVAKRCLCSTTSAMLCAKQHVVPGASQPASAAQQDDFFVDIDSLAGFGEASEQTSSSTTRQSAAAAAGLTAATRHEASADVLGVIRSTPEEEGARYSRLQIPLPPKESDEAGAQVRSNTRAGLPPGEEANYAEYSTGPTEKEEASVQEAEQLLQSSSAGAFEVLHHPDGDGGASQHDSRLPDPERLPYDDERFAEMLLEMEVNGVVDEAWQDARKARVEDVKEIADILTSLKVRDICCIDVSEKTANFDYMMFGTCEGARHIHLAAWAAQDADKVHRISKIKRKQTDELWEVVPIGRIVLNLMVESFREEMTLERKWAVTRTMDPLAAANAPISEGRQVKAHGLWTLTLNLQDLEDFEVDYCKDILMRQM